MEKFGLKAIDMYLCVIKIKITHGKERRDNLG